jgi:hypothetical protein
LDFFGQQRVDVSLRLAQNGVRQMPDNPEARFLLAQAQLSSGNLDAAEESLLALNRTYAEAPALQTEWDGCTAGRARRRRRGQPSSERSGTIPRTSQR